MGGSGADVCRDPVEAWGGGSRGCRSSSVYLAFSRSATRPWVRDCRSAGVLARVGRAGTLARFGAELDWASAIFGSVGFDDAAGLLDEEELVADRYHSTGLTASGTEEQPPSTKTVPNAVANLRRPTIRFSRPTLPIGG